MGSPLVGGPSMVRPTRALAIRGGHGTTTERPRIGASRGRKGVRIRRRTRQNRPVATPESLIDAGVSEREAEVLALIAERATNAEIAAQPFVSVRPVESDVSSLLRKLGVSDRRALARLVDAAAADDAGGGPSQAPATAGGRSSAGGA